MTTNSAAKHRKHRTHLTEEQLIGSRFNKLIVLNEVEGLRSKARYMNCLCDCGKKKDVLLSNLTSGRTRSCGCLRPGFKRIRFIEAGAKYGKLTVVAEREPCGKPARRAVDVTCDCGTELWVWFDNLLAGTVKSCGCLQDAYYESMRTLDGEGNPLPIQTTEEKRGEE